MKHRFSWNLALAVLALVVTQIAAAFDGLVTKRTFQLESYTMVGGSTLKNVRVATSPTAA